VLHELGHAVAARRTGAEAEISLNFLAGYASYVPIRKLSRLEQAGISFAGPAIQIAVSGAILIALGANPLERSSVDGSAALLAIWWAGPVIGVFNLVPILPLDGGHIVLNGLDRFLPNRSERIMLWFSIGATVTFAAYAFTNDRYRGFAIVIGFLLITQLQMLGAMKDVTSPWEDANKAMLAGRQRKATRILIAALSQPKPDRAPPIAKLEPHEMSDLVSLLPDPLPSGDPWNEYILANQLIRLGRFEEAAHYAADSYSRSDSCKSRRGARRPANCHRVAAISCRSRHVTGRAGDHHRQLTRVDRSTPTPRRGRHPPHPDRGHKPRRLTVLNPEICRQSDAMCSNPDKFRVVSDYGAEWGGI